MFCPAINSQCYWLSRETPGEVRASLRQLYAERSAQPYEPVCVVVSAHIDRESGREGFAADYDGLITIAHTYGRCNETRIALVRLIGIDIRPVGPETPWPAGRLLDC